MTTDELIRLIEERSILPKNVDCYGNTFFGTTDEGIAIGWLHYISGAAPKLEGVKPESPLIKNHPHWEQLNQFNGCKLYEGNFILYGVHGHGEMSKSAYPWDWILACLEHDAEEYLTYGDIDELVPIGVTKHEGNRVTLLQNFDAEVFGINLKTGKKICEWTTTDHLISSEIFRLNHVYNAN